MVTAAYYESVAFQVRKPGDAAMGATVGEQAARAGAGGRPAALGARVTMVTTRITGIDSQAGTVSLQESDGGKLTVKARDPA